MRGYKYIALIDINRECVCTAAMGPFHIHSRIGVVFIVEDTALTVRFGSSFLTFVWVGVGGLFFPAQLRITSKNKHSREKFKNPFETS